MRAGMPRQPLPAIIHTLNEIENIEDVIRSVELADEIYLVDSFSTEKCSSIFDFR